MLITTVIFSDTSTTTLYTLSLHDALPIFQQLHGYAVVLDDKVGQLLNAGVLIAQNFHQLLHAAGDGGKIVGGPQPGQRRDRKSTRLNSSHMSISYAVFCLKKKKKT